MCTEWLKRFISTMWKKFIKEVKCGQAPVAQDCFPSYLGGWDQENRNWRLAWENSLGDPISKITIENGLEAYLNSRAPVLPA
jgi:hypothetical protein